MAGAAEVGGVELRPSKMLLSYYYTSFAAAVLVLVILLFVPVLILAPPVNTAIMAVLITPWLLFALYWMPRYFGTIRYRLTKSEMEWRRGVWFRQTGIVPYNRITNIDIMQGPVSRYFGIASLKIQTAGFSAPNARSAEIKIEGIEKFEELREHIMGFVRGRPPVAVEAYREEKAAGGDPVVGELVRIRKLLEKRR